MQCALHLSRFSIHLSLRCAMGADQGELCFKDAKALPTRYASMTGTLVCLADNMLSVQVLAY